MPTSASQGEAAQSTPVADGSQSRPQEHGHERELTITIPVDKVAGAVATSAAQAGHVLSARGGLPLYAGLGVLAAADVIAWPAAVAAGLGYAAWRRWGPWAAPARPPWEAQAAGTGSPRAGVTEVGAEGAEKASAARPGRGAAGAAPAGATPAGATPAGATPAGAAAPAAASAGAARAAGTARGRTRVAGTRAGRSGGRTPATGTSRARRAAGPTRGTDAEGEPGPQAQP